MSRSLHLVLLCLLCVSCFTGCLPKPTAPPSDPVVVSSWGISNLVNLGGTPVGMRIQWLAQPGATSYNVYLMVTDPQTGSPTWSLVSRVPSTLASVACIPRGMSAAPASAAPSCLEFIHRDPGVTRAGSVNTYRVRFVRDGVEDNNASQLSVTAFPGIASVKITGTTTATVSIDTDESYVGVRVTATPTRCLSTGAWGSATAGTTTIATLCANATAQVNFSTKASSIPITGLIPGTSYKFNVQVFSSGDTNGAADGNQVSVIGQTNSIMYGSGADNEDTSVYGYRNVRLVQVFGDAPNEINTTTLATAPANLTPSLNPSVRQAHIIANPPQRVTSSAKLRLIRTSGTGLTGNSPPVSIDTSSQIPCTPNATASCVVCPSAMSVPVQGDCDQNFVDGSGNPAMITDANLVDPTSTPRSIKYYYTVTQVYNAYVVNSVTNNGSVISTQTVGSWSEELPPVNALDFTFTASVPDPYMVLVQRDSANYEMCSLLGQSVDPRHFNRCLYSGIGATPYTTSGVAIPVTSGFYDFGYNLFVDRHQMSCNWNRLAGDCSSVNGCFNFAVDPTPTNGAGYFLDDINSTPLAVTSLATNFAHGNGYDMAFNLGYKGANCFINTSPNSGPTTWSDVGSQAVVANSTSNSGLKQALVAGTTADPGLLGSTYANRKQPVITGVTNLQAQNLCNIHQISNGANKRLLRRREYVAASGMPAFSGEPNYQISSPLRWKVVNGSGGQTFYDWSKSDGSFGDGSMTGANKNPGACAVTASPQALSDYNQTGYTCTAAMSVAYNTKVPVNSSKYCALPAGCNYTYSNAGPATSAGCGNPLNGGLCSLNLTGHNLSCFTGSIQASYLDPRNESAHISESNVNSMQVFTHPYFIGSLATNQCVSRFGIQDPYGASAQSVTSPFVAHNTSSALGIVLMDTFAQQLAGSGTMTTTGGTTNANGVSQYEGDQSLVSFTPISNTLDLGVIHDYSYNGISYANFGGVASASSSFSMVGSARSRAYNCYLTANSPQYNDYFSGNYYFLNINTNAGNIGTCQNNPNPSTTTTLTPPQYNFATLPGYLPVMGIPLTSFALSSGQQSVEFNNFLGSQLNQNPSDYLTYARSLILSAGPTTVNMSTGLGNRWSFELSETPAADAGVTVLCAVEAE